MPLMQLRGLQRREKSMNHVYRTYENLGITVCQNCAKFQLDIQRQPHYIFEHGYCASDCARCAAEICIPPALELIKPV
jgi:hypothetical protein